MDDNDQALGRSERRLLRRVFNGRTVPIVIDGAPLLTYKEATRHLLSLPPDERDTAYAAMKAFAGKRKAESPKALPSED